MKPVIGDKLFVYGTLRPECRAYHILEGKTSLVGEGEVKGARLYDLGAFPGLKLSDDPTDVVHGVVFCIINESLPSILDTYEGYPFLYDRKLLETTEGKAWTYLYNHDVSEDKYIPSGDWMT